MKLGLIHRDEIRKISSLLEEELDFLISAISTTFLQEHDWEGRHTDIAVNSLRQRFDNLQNTTPSVDGIGTVTGDEDTVDEIGISMAVTVTTNNDKTGYSLTAGSYSIQASSVQRGTIQITATSQTASISSVTMTRAVEHQNGNSAEVSSGTGGYV